MVTPRDRVLVAGIGGASLGTELAKCLRLAGRYTVFGCDISPLAYGHYDEHFEATDVVDERDYVQSVLTVALRHDVAVVIPGAEGAASLLHSAASKFDAAGVAVARCGNNAFETCSDKGRFFATLKDGGLRTPWTHRVNAADDLPEVPEFPCVVKPVRGTGGSRFVSVAEDVDGLGELVATTLPRAGELIIQQYIPVDEGEYTVGVLRLPAVGYCGSLALRRAFDSKLSTLEASDVGLLSSGYSQGFVDDFEVVREQAEAIADAIDVDGPINIQGRLWKGSFLPFEANPRFSASAFLRAMAGMNEPDAYLRYLLHGEVPAAVTVRRGYYLRTLCETYVPVEAVRR